MKKTKVVLGTCKYGYKPHKKMTGVGGCEGWKPEPPKKKAVKK